MGMNSAVDPLDDAGPSCICPPRQRASRGRPLTIADENASLAAHDQMQSVLFGKLPSEVRYLIYKEVLGGWILLIDGPTSDLRPPRLLWKVNMMTCECEGPNMVWHGRKDSVYEKSDLLPLVMTCRRVYALCLSFPFLFCAPGITTNELERWLLQSKYCSVNGNNSTTAILNQSTFCTRKIPSM